MDEELTALQGIIDNPDDLSTLPQVIEKLKAYKESHTEQSASDLERITKLQQANRNLLAQIPIPGSEPVVKEEDSKPTFEDAQKELLNALQNIGGN